jgi:hypothetical protein
MVIMKVLFRFCLAALAGVPLLVSSASAQVSVRAPLTQVEVGPNQVQVQAPFVRIQVPLAPPPPPPVVVAPAPPPPQPSIAPALPALATFPTPVGFATGFKPAPGSYEVVLQHPFTLQPVKVCFTLPVTAGCYRTHVRPRLIAFDSPDHTVEIRFLRNGRVEIDKD